MTMLQFRTHHDMTQGDLAARIRVTVAAISNYENGRRIPKQVVMERIVAFTKKAVTPNDFHGVSAQ